MRQPCKVCGVNAESEYCFRHKPRKAMPMGRSVTLTSDVAPDNIRESKWVVMRTFFLSIWKTRPHKSEVSGTFLGNEPLSVFFHHILPKSDPKYMHLRYDEENIILLTLEEHESVELDMYKYEEINKRRKALLFKHDLWNPSDN